MKLKNIVIVCSTVLGGTALSGASWQAAAQTAPVKPTYQIPGGEAEKEESKDGPLGVALSDGVTLIPFANLSFGKDDNLFLANANKKSSNLTIFNPGLKLAIKGDGMQLGIGAESKIGRYGSSSDDNYQDQRFNAVADFSFSSKIGLRLGGLYEQSHDPRGSTDRVGATKPDEFDNSGVNALFAYGGNDAMGRVEFEAGSFKKRYTNNRISTAGSDRKTDSFAGRFFVRVAPKTSLFIELREDKLDYSLDTSLQDSKERRYLLGATWDATAATSGTVKFGQIRKDFASSLLKDYSGTGWEGNIRWTPLSYSKFDFFTSKSFTESTGLGDFILNKRYGVAWNHDWDSRLSSTLSFVRADDTFSGNSRNDTTDSSGFRLNYKLMRWLTLGGEFSHSSRDSNLGSANYRKNLYMFTVGATL